MWQRPTTPRLLTLALLALAPAGAQEAPFDLVPEMETPPGIVAARGSERARLPRGEDAEEALALFQERVATLWETIRRVDLVALSRYQIEATKGYELPQTFDGWRGEVVGRGDDGRYYLELRGPRLPGRHDIVFRYLTVYAAYDPSSRTIGRPVVTLRGWVEE
jgi:hypothetical protein